MKIRYLLAVAAVMAAAAPLKVVKAQSPKEAAENVHKTLKKAGRDTKAEVKRASSGAHRALKANGNEAKEEAGEVTGPVKTPAPLDKAAHKISHASKKGGRHAKHALKKSSSRAHHALKKAGNDTKAALDTVVKKP